CKGCYICIEVCPEEMIEIEKNPNKKGYLPAKFKENPSNSEAGCNACTQCAIVCPEVAIEVYRAK
ncbi:MAG: 4Fe-4S dicluster domain-containing protein, partial [Desulfobacteraceae bacterium]